MYNEFHTDHIAFAEMPLAVHIQNAINRHIANSGVHITEEDKKAWDAKADKEDLDEIWEALDKKADKEEGGDDPQPTPEKGYYTKPEIDDKLNGYVTDQELECRLSSLSIPENISDLEGSSNLVTNSILNEALRVTNQFVRKSDKLFTINGTPVYVGDSVDVESGSGGDPYVLPKASSTDLGGIKTGFSGEENQYAVNVDEAGNGYVEVDLSSISQELNSLVGDVNNIKDQIEDLPQTLEHVKLHSIQDDKQWDSNPAGRAYVTIETGNTNGRDSRLETFVYDPELPDSEHPERTGGYVGGMTINNDGIYSGSPLQEIDDQPHANYQNFKYTKIPTPMPLEDINVDDQDVPAAWPAPGFDVYHTCVSYGAALPYVYDSNEDAVYAQSYRVRVANRNSEDQGQQYDSLKGLNGTIWVGDHGFLFIGGILVGYRHASV